MKNIKSKRDLFLLFLLFFLLIKPSFSQIQIPYLEPKPYFPIYPGSSWRYLVFNGVSSIGDTITSKVSDDYKVFSWQNRQDTGPSWFSVFTLLFEGEYYNGYSKSCNSTPSGFFWQPFFSDSLNQEWIQDCDSRYCNNGGCTARKVISIDTSIVIQGNTYDSVVVIKTYGWVWLADPSHKPTKVGNKEYYAKNVGLIKLTSYDSNGVETTLKELLDFKIVRKKFQTISFNVKDTLTIGQPYILNNVKSSSGLQVILDTTRSNNNWGAKIKGDTLTTYCEWNLPPITVLAIQPGNDEYYIALKDTSFTLKIPADSCVKYQTITGFNSIHSQTFGNPPLIISGVSASSGLPVTFYSSDTSVVSVSGDTLFLLSAGTSTITAVQVGGYSNMSGSGFSIWTAHNYRAANPVSQVLVVTNTVSGVASFEKKEISFEVYPNPSTGTFTITFKNPSELGKEVLVYNNMGQHITTLKKGEASLPRGLYLLRCVNESRTLVVE